MDVKKIQRTTLIFTIWTFLYFLWFRWFMLTNWQFNIFLAQDWQLLYHKWWYEGWIIEGSYFWIFVISLFLFIPIWIWGFCFFLSRNYSHYMEKLFWDSIYKKKTKKVQQQNKNIRVKKKKSYKEVRPKALATTPQTVAPVQSDLQPADLMTETPSTTQKLFMEEKMPAMENSFSSRELTDDFGGESPFAQDLTNFEMSVPDLNDEVKPLNENLSEIMEKAGAVVFEKPVVDGNSVDYMAVAKGQIFFVLTDSEKGDWLADEERFNDEDPLWFSETSHRVSPITILKNFETAFKASLNDSSYQTHIILVKTDGNIINAEDMLDVWRDMNVLVARSATGAPAELPSFGETFPSELDALDAEDIEKIQMLIAQ